MKKEDKDLNYYTHNKTCLYCKHNCNTENNFKIQCVFQFNGTCNSYLKQKFEWCDKDRKEILDKLVAKSARNNDNDTLYVILTAGYFFVTFATLLVLIFLTMKLRFSNPQFTETQIFLETWRRYPILSILLLFLAFLPTIISRRK